MKRYDVEFRAEFTINIPNVEAKTEQEAINKAEDLFLKKFFNTDKELLNEMQEGGCSLYWETAEEIN